MISTKSFCQYFYRFRIISNQEEIFTLWKVSKTYWMSFNTKVNNFWKSSIQKGVYSSGHVPCFEMETWTRTHFKSHKALAMNLLWTKKKNSMRCIEDVLCQINTFFQNNYQPAAVVQMFLLRKKIAAVFMTFAQFVWYSFVFYNNTLSIV